MANKNVIVTKPGIYGAEVLVIPRGNNKTCLRVSCQEGTGEFLAGQEEVAQIASSLMTSSCPNKELAAVIDREISILQRWKRYASKNPEVDTNTILKGLDSELRII